MELHIGFVRGTVAFAMIAEGASTGGIAPGILAAPADGQDVVEGIVTLVESAPALLIAGLGQAVNAGEIISPQNPDTTPAGVSSGDIDIAP